MKALEEKIRKEGKILPGNVLKVSSFLNQQIDVPFMMEMGREIAGRYAEEGVTKILTVESSGIAVAMAAAVPLGVPVVFAKKTDKNHRTGRVLCAEVASYTHGGKHFVEVDAAYLSPADRVLVVDDFLACGNAMVGLIDLIKQAGAHFVGAAVAIEKRYQGGGDKLRAEGMRIEALASIASVDPEAGIAFC